MFQGRASQIAPFPEDFSFTSSARSDPTVEQLYELLQRIFQRLLHEAARSISCVPDNPEYKSEQGEAIYQQLTSNYKEGVLEACQEFVRLNLFDYRNSPFCRLSICSIYNFLDGNATEEQYILTMLEALNSVDGDTFIKEGLASMISETYMKEYGRNETL